MKQMQAAIKAITAAFPTAADIDDCCRRLKRELRT